MSKSAFLTTCAVGAMLLAGCGGGGGTPGNAAPSAAEATWANSAITFELADYADDEPETADADLIYEIVTQPVDENPNTPPPDWGTISFTDPVAFPGRVFYTPGSTPHTGVEYFTYRVIDEGGRPSSVATVWIGVNNAAPTATTPVNLATDEDAALAITVGDLGVTDANDDPVLFELVDGPVNGTLSAFPTTLVDLGAPLVTLVTYTPNEDYPEVPVGSGGDPGSDFFTFTVTDMVGTPAVITVNITIDAVNDVPVADNVGATVGAGGSVVIQLSGSDADNDTPLTYYVTGLPLVGMLYDDGHQILVTELPYLVTDGLNQLSFDAPWDQWGLYSFTYVVNDGTVDSAPATVNITISPPPQSCWGWGKNTDGQLGLGTGQHLERNPYPKKLSGEAWEMADGGANHSVLLTETGIARTTGDNSDGQCGLGDMVLRKELPTTVANFSPSRWVAAGQGHTLSVHTDGTVWATGWNLSGQLADGTSVTTTTPVETIFRDALEGGGDVVTPDIIQASAGNNHSIACDSAGYVWVWGSNGNGQLGLPGEMEQHWGVQIPPASFDDAFIVAVAAGGNHSMALTAGGGIYSWGESIQGQVHANQAMTVGAPQYLPNYGQGLACQSISCGRDHSLAATTTGRLYAWGDNQYGQLGNDDDPNDNDDGNIGPLAGLFVDVDDNPIVATTLDFVEVAAGGEHSLARTSDGRVFACGSDNYGQVGVNNADAMLDIVIWKEVGFTNPVLGIGAGLYHSFAIRQEW